MPELTDESSAIKTICLRLLARREHSQQELRDKLALRGFDRRQTQWVVDGLIRQGWQSDQRFAESYARYRIRKGFGPRIIDYELQRHGIQAIDLDAVLLDLLDDWLTLLKQVYSKKYAENGALTPAEWIKRSRFLLQRGFSGEMITKFFQTLKKRG